MRLVTHATGLGALLSLAACQATTLFTDAPAAPVDLTYQLEPSGDPDRPAGIILAWAPGLEGDVAAYRVYSRGSTGEGFASRGETTSNTFHDNGVPHLQYYVTALDFDGNESAPSNAVTIDERLQLPAPTVLTSISLNGAIHLGWTDNAYESAPARFSWYRVYSTTYDLDRGLCGTQWSLEGTSVAPEFLAGVLVNGAPRCFGVSALSREGYESLWSPLRQDTPRPDARNVLVVAIEEDAAAAGFRFWDDGNGDGVAQRSELGLVLAGDRSDIDFFVQWDAALGVVSLAPKFAGTRVRFYADAPIADLTSIDFAPAAGYGRTTLQALPGFGYVFEIVEGGSVRYGGLRVTHVGRGYLIFDWSFQSDPGNPELIRMAPMAAR
ncbi:MAG: fibronectin type III domain-containing protein [Gemmatimonadales bacterium]